MAFFFFSFRLFSRCVFFSTWQFQMACFTQIFTPFFFMKSQLHNDILMCVVCTQCFTCATLSVTQPTIQRLSTANYSMYAWSEANMKKKKQATNELPEKMLHRNADLADDELWHIMYCNMIQTVAVSYSDCVHVLLEERICRAELKKSVWKNRLFKMANWIGLTWLQRYQLTLGDFVHKLLCKKYEERARKPLFFRWVHTAIQIHICWTFFPPLIIDYYPFQTLIFVVKNTRFSIRPVSCDTFMIWSVSIYLLCANLRSIAAIVLATLTQLQCQLHFEQTIRVEIFLPHSSLSLSLNAR